MFDWNDEELTNILWGEAGESDDHIVPFQEGTEDYHKKKEWNQEGTSTTKKPSEQRTSETTHDFPGSKSDGTPSLKKDDCGKSTYGFTSGSWPEFSSSSAAQNDPDVETAELDKGPENFQNSLDDKEQGDFDDYSWANIGSFDDLNRILSNDDSIFGPGSLDNADELWSSKDLPNNFELGASGNFDIKTEYEQSDDPPFVPNYERTNLPDQVEENRGGRSKPSAKEKACLVTGGKATVFKSRVAAEKAANPYQLADKACGKKKPLKGRKKTQQKSERKSPQDFYNVWNPYGQYEMVQFPSSSALQYQQIPSPFIAHPTYVNFANPYPMMPMISHIQPPVLSGYEVSPTNKSKDNTWMKTLTPQEKIEKLRRRQQMRALHAIKKQQQQFAHQAGHHSISQENQIQSVESSGLTHEDLSVLPLFDPNSPLEQEDSNNLSLAIDDYSAEESVLHRLQDITSKLDVRVRLCIRDSLFRLARTALQRNYPADGSSPTKSGGNAQEIIGQNESDGGNRCPKLPDTETKTNSIDRIVAHLLFRKPMDSPGQNPDTFDSPAYLKNPMEQETGSLTDNPNIDNSENPTNYGPESGGAVE